MKNWFAAGLMPFRYNQSLSLSCSNEKSSYSSDLLSLRNHQHHHLLHHDHLHLHWFFFSCKRQRTLNAHKFHAYLSLGPNLDRHPPSVPASAYTRVFDACQSILSHGPLSILVSINRKYFTLWLWHHVSRFPMLLGTFLFLHYILFSTMPRTMFCTLWVLSKFLLNNFIFWFLFLDSTNTKLYTRGLHSPSQWEFSGIGKSH